MHLPSALVLCLAVAVAKPLHDARHHHSLAARHWTDWTDTASTASSTWTDGTATLATVSTTATATDLTSATTPTNAATIPEASLILATTVPSSQPNPSPAATSTTPSHQPNASAPAQQAPAHPVNGGAIAGAVVAVLLVLAALIAATLYYRRRRPLASGTEKATLTSPSLDDTTAASDPFRASTPSPLAGRAISPPLPLQPRVHASSFSSIGIGTPPPPLGSWRPRGNSSFGPNALAPPGAAATPSRTLGAVLQRA